MKKKKAIKKIQNNIIYEDDNIGSHKVMLSNTGVKIKILKSPSKEYLEKKKKNNEKMKKICLEKKIIDEKEKMIAKKIRDMAIRELKQEGKL